MSTSQVTGFASSSNYFSQLSHSFKYFNSSTKDHQYFCESDM